MHLINKCAAVMLIYTFIGLSSVLMPWK